MTLEAELSHRIGAWLLRDFGFVRVRVVRGYFGASEQLAMAFSNRIDDARERKDITSADYVGIFGAGVIARCRRSRDSQPVWVVVEVAAHIDEEIIKRAAQSAATLEVVFGEEGLPVVAGERIEPLHAARARQIGVAYIDVTERF